MELYVHLPFCRQKCSYCDFASWAGQEGLMPAYVDAVLAEAAAMSSQLGAPEIETLYLGGGTPSLLPPSLAAKLLSGLRAVFPFAPDAECTSEANPGTVTSAWLEAVTAGGINRLSMGMQAAQPELLRILGRIHNPEDVAESVRLARAAGIQNLSLDLMFGLPGQTAAMWQETLKAALAFEPQHLSCYGLIPEEGTPLRQALDEGSLHLPDEDAEREMYDLCLHLLAAHGFAQYEISNFALPGYACRHNIGYWRQTPYLGLGVAAASCLPCDRDGIAYVRTQNPADIHAYLQTPIQRQQQVITYADACFETLMLGLRMTEGVSDVAFKAMHEVPLAVCYGRKLARLSQQGLLLHENGCWRLTRRGMDIMNTVLVELMDDYDDD